MRKLENEKLIVEISDHGAELSRVYDKVNGEERLFDADPKFWNRHAPVLFPFVGACYGKKYRYNKSEYDMGQHGFARDSEFEVVEHNDFVCTHRLVSDENTRKNYPFDFELLITHELSADEIRVKWTVINKGSDNMLFQIGAHPAFMIGNEKSFKDVSLDFRKDGIRYYRIEDPGSGCCFEDKSYEFDTAGGIISLKTDFFDKGVYILEENSVDSVSMLVNGREKLRMTCKDFPWFGIWSKKDAPYICLEPWHGRCDSFGFTGELEDRCAVKKLEPSGEFKAEYVMKFL